MALTVTHKTQNALPLVANGFHVAVVDVLYDSSYATGGEALLAGDFRFPAGVSVILCLAEPRSGFVFEYDRTNSKLKAFVPGVAIGAAGAATIDDFPLSGTGATATSVGLASTATTPVRFGPLQEVASAVDLSSITTRVVAFGAVV